MLQCYLLQMVCDMDEWGDSHTCKWAYVNELMWWWHSHVYACLCLFDEMMLWSYDGLCCGMVTALLWWIMVMAEWFPHMNAMVMAGWFLHMKEKFYGWKYAQGYLRRSRDVPPLLIYSIGDPHTGGYPNKRGMLTPIRVLKTRALIGKGPFKALARWGWGTAIDGWWCQLPVAKTRVSPCL